MNKLLFQGVCTALVTPFLDGVINYPMMELLIRRQMDAGIRTILLAGTTGEAPTLTDDEKLELFRRAKAYAGDECMILAGTGYNSTSHTAQFSAEAADTGIDGLLIVSPYYNKATSEGLVAHYLTVAHSVRLPIIIYNVPSRTGLDIPLEVYRRLSHIPNIAGIKEASNSISKITKTCYSCPELTVWSGCDDLVVPAISVGAKGVISVISNVAPVETKAMVDAALDGDMDTAMALQQQLQPLNELLFCEVNPIPVKAAMRKIGYDCGECRLPLSGLSADNQRKLEQYFL